MERLTCNNYNFEVQGEESESKNTNNNYPKMFKIMIKLKNFNQYNPNNNPCYFTLQSSYKTSDNVYHFDNEDSVLFDNLKINDILELHLISLQIEKIKYPPANLNINELVNNKIGSIDLQINEYISIRLKYLLTKSHKYFNNMINFYTLNTNNEISKKLRLSNSIERDKEIKETKLLNKECDEVRKYYSNSLRRGRIKKISVNKIKSTVSNSNFAEESDKSKENKNIKAKAVKFNTVKSNRKQSILALTAIKNTPMRFNTDPNDLMEATLVPIDDYYEKKLGDNFCEAFFVSALPNNEAKLINDSGTLISPCQHENCSLTYAYKPEIVYRFPGKDSKNFELNNCDASLCFPNGIKLCFEKNEKKIKPINNFMTIITNANGDRLYMMNYHFFKKVDVVTYQRLYRDANPLRYFYTNILAQLEDKSTTKIQIKQIQKMREVVNKFMENDFFYVPYCFSLISSYPNAFAMEKVIGSIIKIISSGNDELLTDILTHILYELPAPPTNSSITFTIPYCSQGLEIVNSIHKNLLTTNFELVSILDLLSIDNIIIIINLLLHEQKLLFISANGDYNTLTHLTESFITLLYPLKWVNTYVPVLTEDLVKYLQSFMPFIMGIDEKLVILANNYMDCDGVYIVDLKKESVYASNGKTERKKVELKNIGKFIPAIPEESSKFLQDELKTIKKDWEKVRIKDKEEKIDAGMQVKRGEISKSLRNTFVKFMVYLYGDYKNYTSYIDGVPLFNINSFCMSKNSSNSVFYTEFTQTHVFRHFLQVAAGETENNYLEHFKDICLLKNVNNSILKRTNTKKNNNDDNNIFSFFSKNKNEKIESLNNPPNTSRNSSKKVINFNQINDYNTNINSSNINNNSNDMSIYKKSYENYNKNYKLLPIFEASAYKSIETENFQKRIFSEKFEFSILNKIEKLPEELRTYPRVNKRLSKYRESNLLFHFFKPKEITEDENDEDKSDEENMNNDKEIDIDDDKAKESLGKDVIRKESCNSNSDEQLSPKVKSIRPPKYSVFKQIHEIKEKRNFFIKMLEKDDKISSIIKQQVRKKQSLISIILTNDQKQLETYQEQIGNIIKDEMGKVLTSTLLGKENVRDLSYMFKYRYARSIFSKILYQDSFNEHVKICLEEGSFREIYELITNLLICCQNDSQYEDVRLITKSLFYYYTIIENENSTTSFYFIYQEISKRSPFNFWKQLDFWKFFLDAEIASMGYNTPLNSKDIDDYYFGMLIHIARIMMDLKIDMQIIYRIICNNLVYNYIKKDVVVKELRKTLETIELMNNQLII